MIGIQRGRIVGFERTRPQWVRTGLIDQQPNWLVRLCVAAGARRGNHRKWLSTVGHALRRQRGQFASMGMTGKMITNVE